MAARVGRPQREFGQSRTIAKIDLPKRISFNSQFRYYLKRAKAGYVLIMRVIRFNAKLAAGETRKTHRNRGVIAMHLRDINYPKNCVLCLLPSGEIILTKGYYEGYHQPAKTERKSRNPDS